jgi:2-dehydropantoate 2-reductase
MVQGYGERWASNDYRQEGETAMTSLHVEGAVETPRAFSFTDLASLPGQVPDIGRLIPGRQGGGVWLRSLLDATGARPQASHLTLHASDGDFSASVPLEAVRDRAIVVYRFGEGPLPAAQGGPMRFFITHIEACAVGEVDACANVKFLGTIQLTIGPGVDTRPTSVRDHEALHQQAGHEHLPERS